MLPSGFVYLDEAVPGTLTDAKYAGHDNFVGQPVDGYFAPRVVGSKELADALLCVRDTAAVMRLHLLFWDAYRPQRAVNHFIRWSQQPEDGRTKAAHYPRISKTDLIPQGYVAEKSGHSRGGTIDLTLATLSGRPLDMGGDFDLMDERSHHGFSGCTAEQAKNRLLLRRLMEQAGFASYAAEWWHYRLIDEPYPDTYFDFPII